MDAKTLGGLGVLFLALAAACSGSEEVGSAPIPTQPVALPAAQPNTAAPVDFVATSAPEVSASAGVADQVPVAGTAVAPESAVAPGFCEVTSMLNEHCTACHDGNRTAGAPMALLSHDDLLAPAVTDASKSVYELVAARMRDPMRPMPPQGMLPEAQLASFDAWVAAGTPGSADPGCAAPAAADTEQGAAWPDDCDEIYTILASDDGGPNSIGPGTESHPQFFVAPPWGNEEVQAIAWRAITDNPQVLHHWILYGPSGEFLFGWAPGKDRNEGLPADVGVYLPPQTMRMDVHYNNLGGAKAETDLSGVEICVLKKENFRPKTATVTSSLSSFLISIPPSAGGHEVTGTCTHSGSPVRVLSASPHAHRMATHMRFTVEKANGETVVMHDGPFNFEEQTTYRMDPPVVVESGDRIITTCTYNNDTNQVVTFGENTDDEMCFNFALYEPMGGLRCGRGGFGGFGGFGQ